MEKVPGDDAFLARRREESAGGLGSVVGSSGTSCGQRRLQRPRSPGSFLSVQGAPLLACCSCWRIKGYGAMESLVSTTKIKTASRWMWFGLDEKVGHQGRPGLARTPAPAFIWVRGNVSLPGSGHGLWRRQWGPGGLRICPVCVPGGAAGRGSQGGEGHSLTHPRDPQRASDPRSRQPAVVAGRMKRVPEAL